MAMSNPPQTIIQPSEDEVVETTSSNSQNYAEIYNMDVNYAHQNKWFAYFPLEDVLGSSYKNLNLHLTRFTIPQLQQSSQTISYRGYEKQIPAKVLNPSTKQVTLDYIVDEDLYNYTALYSWTSGIVGVINPIATDVDETKNSIAATDYIPLRIYMLDSYKRKTVELTFTNTWIESFGDFQLDVNSPAVVVNSFTLVFDDFSIQRFTK